LAVPAFGSLDKILKKGNMPTQESIRRLGLITVLLAVFSLPAFSQSCPMCYTQAAASGARFIAALRSGILVLAIPPIFMSIGITVMAYRKRNQFHSSEGDERSDCDW
jgi:hypothetical protein